MLSLKDLKVDSGVFALDLETRDPNLTTLGPGWAFPRTEGYPIGYAVAWRSEESGELKSVYLPVRHEPGANYEMSEVRAFLGPLLADERRRMVAANVLYDYGWTLWDGFEINCQLSDVQIKGPLIDEERMSYSLDNLAKSYLNKRKEKDIFDEAKEFGYTYRNTMENLWRLPAGVVESYARTDAELTVELDEHFEPLIVADGLQEVLALEERLIPILYHMRKRGVRVDVEKTHHLIGVYTDIERELQDRIVAMVGDKVDPWAAAQLVAALRKVGVEEFPITPKSKKESVDQAFLEGLITGPDPKVARLAALFLHARKTQKTRSTFLENMVLEHAVDGRIHCQFNALRSDDGGTVSGRFSSSSPNLQQVPSRDPLTGPLIRSLFLPEQQLWGSLDYSSQEPRLAVHFATQLERAGLIRPVGAEDFAESWIADPRMDAYQATADLCGVTRKEAKAIRLGVLYGMGGGKLSQSLGLDFELGTYNGREVVYAGPEGKKLLNTYHTNSPMDRELANFTQDVAKSRGFVRTILGRRSRFKLRDNGERWFTHKSLNRIIQGSAADMIKRAMVDCWDAGYPPMLTVHDELAFDVESKEQAEKEIAPLMENAIPLEVPVVVDVEVGKTWGHSMTDGKDPAIPSLEVLDGIGG